MLLEEAAILKAPMIRWEYQLTVFMVKRAATIHLSPQSETHANCIVILTEALVLDVPG